MDGHAFDSESLALRMRLRQAALIALGGGLLFLPVETRYRPPEMLATLLSVWAIHALLCSAALAASALRLSVRFLDRLVLVLVVGYIANAFLYLYLSPDSTWLVANGLTCVLMVAVVLFSWDIRRMVAVAVLACGGFGLVGAVVGAGHTTAILFPLGPLVVSAAITIATARVLEQFRARLARRESELGALSTQLMSVQEEERRRLSRELHDEFGQKLTAVMLLLEREPPAGNGAARERLDEARRLVGRTLAAMRELSRLLRPPSLDDFGLVPSLDTHLKAFAERHQIEVTFHASQLPERLPADTETALYRIAQEALTNVARHSQARRVRIDLGVRNAELELDVQDDGVGFVGTNGSSARGGTGLIGIRERVRGLGGTMSIAGGRGVRLSVRLPLSR